ncbi:MAG: FAD:protein FMN transferase, partial [Dermatophilaceae bacterium]
MTSRTPHPVNVALRRTRRWTAGVLLTSTLAAGGLGLHLADANAANKTDAAVAAGAAATTMTSSATGSSSTPTTSPATTSSTATANPSSTTSSTTTGSSSSGSSASSPTKSLGAGLVELRRHEHEGLVMTVYRHDFSAIGCQHTILTLDPAALVPGGELAENIIEQLDLVASRFRPDSEVSRIAELASSVDVRVVVSPLLGRCIEAALHAAKITDGLVDPTVGRAVAACGYDADIE